MRGVRLFASIGGRAFVHRALLISAVALIHIIAYGQQPFTPAPAQPEEAEEHLQQRPRKPTLQPLTLQPGTPFAFGCTAPPSADLLANLTRWMFDTLQPTARATVAWDCALGPFGGDESADVYSQYGTPALFCGTGMRSLTPDAVAVLRKLDAAGVYSSFGLGEWGSEFHCLTPAEDPKADPGCGAWEHGYLHPRSDCGPSGYFNISLDPALSGSINCSRVDCSKLVLGRNPHNSTEA
jgi:hypothetical protein